MGWGCAVEVGRSVAAFVRLAGGSATRAVWRSPSSACPLGGPPAAGERGQRGPGAGGAGRQRADSGLCRELPSAAALLGVSAADPRRELRAAPVALSCALGEAVQK